MPSEISKSSSDFKASSPCRILLVEDHGDTAEVFCTILNHAGHEVRVARTYAQAVEFSAHVRFDIVLCDISLPDGNGNELPQRIKSNHPETRVIAVTGKGMPAEQRASYAAGFDDFLLKPVDIEALLAKLAGCGDSPT